MSKQLTEAFSSENSGNFISMADFLRAEGREEGREEGRAEGRVNSLRDVVRSMLANDMSTDIVQKVTGLTLEQIDSFRADA